jgi:hypothetical protein
MRMDKNLFHNHHIIKILLLIFLSLSNFAIYSQDNSAQINMEFIEKESGKIVVIHVLEEDSLGTHPVNGLEVFLYVKRMFSDLPLGDRFNFTDKKGIVEIEFPSDLPGDLVGNLDVILKIEDAETIKDTVVYAVVKWGIPEVFEKVDEKRSLWAARANAPLSLLILVNVMLFTVWGIIIYIFFELYLIKKDNKSIN